MDFLFARLVENKSICGLDYMLPNENIWIPSDINNHELAIVQNMWIRS